MRSRNASTAVAIAALLAVAPVLAVSTGLAVAPVAGDGTATSNPCIGTVSNPPDRTTVVSVQGARITPDGYEKRPALLFAVAPNGSVTWIRNASAHGRWWAYDVEPLPDDTYLFTTTQGGSSVVGRYDPARSDYVWTERFDGAPDSDTNPLVVDAHDADLLDDQELVIADKGAGHNRLLVYNRTRARVTWEWRFNDSEAFPRAGGGPPQDWTHVNDVDRINVSNSQRVAGEGEWFVASVRNFDTVAFINRSSGDLEVTLGADGDHDVLRRQHNPDHLWGPSGRHTLLVADSRNDRVVEYAYDHDAEDWERVWEVRGLDEPRDADRLPNGNTLIADRMGHRTVEVTPEGEVVWEFYTPYEPYDADRGGDGSSGPTMQELNASGSYVSTGGADFDDDDVGTCAAALYERAPSLADAIAADVTGGEPDEQNGRLLFVSLAGVLLGAVGVAGAGLYRWRY
jgi:hypothetical protein